MRQMSSPVNQPVNKAEDPDDILGQFYFAFGQGAGTMRVGRDAIAALRRRYYPGIQVASGSWDEMAGNVLSLLAQVGRLAALLATQAGHTAIGHADFMQARQMVEAGVHKQHKAAGLMAGPVCPHYPEDGDQPTPMPGTDPAAHAEEMGAPAEPEAAVVTAGEAQVAEMGSTGSAVVVH